MKQKLLMPQSKQGVIGSVMVLVVVLLVIIIGAIGYVAITQTAVGEGKEIKKKVLASCEIAPTVTWTALNKENPGTTVATGGNAIINKEFFGPVASGSSGTTFARGDMLKLLIGAPNFINTTVELGPLECGDNKVAIPIYATGAGTLTLLDQNYNSITDAVTGAVALNVTSSANNIRVIMRLAGTKDESTGDLLVTMETNTTQVDDITLSVTAGGGAEVLDGDFGIATGYDLFAEEFSGASLKKAFIVAPVIDGGQHDYTATFIPETGVTIGGGSEPRENPVFVNVYSSQYYVETDGTFVLGWEDKDGTLKYEDAWTDFDFLIE